MPIYQMLRAKAITGYGRLGKVPRPLPSSCPDRDEIALGAALRNEDALVWVGDGLVPRPMAKVCVVHDFGLCRRRAIPTSSCYVRYFTSCRVTGQTFLVP